MLTLNDIINVSFRKSNFSGYRTEDVDNFIDQVKDSYDMLIKKTIEQKEANEALTAQNAQLNKKLEVLANKIEDYRKEEGEIKTALISAQKLGEASVREARHKAEIILKDAGLKAERIVGTAKTDVVEQQRELDHLKRKVSDFRTKLLALYKEHLTMINAIPTQREEPVQETAEEPVADFSVEEPQQVPELQQTETLENHPSKQHEEPEATFAVDASVFEESESSSAAHDLRYDVLKFGDDYEISGE